MRMRVVGLAVLLLSLVGAVSLGWMAARGLGLVHGLRPATIPLLGALGLAGAVVVVTVLGTVLSRLANPLGDIMEGAERVASGDYATRVPERGPPAIRSLAHAFNTMTERLESHDQQRRHLMADVAHELRTPLTVMQGRLEGILDGVYPRDEAQLAHVLDEMRVLARLVEDLRTLALTETGALRLQKEPADAGILVQDAVEAFTAQADAQGVVLRVEAPADLPLMEVDPVRIHQVLANLLSNALRHTPAGGRVSVAATATGDGAIALEVSDTGAGMEPEALARIFDRFYKGADSRGSGLGLTIARNLVALHGGHIRAKSQPGRGTAITFTLPVLR